MKISVLMAELSQVEEFFGDIETTTNDVAVVQGLEHDKIVRLGIPISTGRLDRKRFERAYVNVEEYDEKAGVIGRGRKIDRIADAYDADE